MQRIKLLQATKYGKKGEVLLIDNNEAFGLIDSGQAILTKEMNSDDYKTSGDLNGKPTIVRTHKRS